MYNRERYTRMFHESLDKDLEFLLSRPCAAVMSRPTGIIWENVEEIRLRISKIDDCPICLETLVLPRITSCGHIFCYPCVVEYQVKSNQALVECPICKSIFDAIKSPKPLRVFKQNEYRIGDSIDMKLVKKLRNTRCIVPIESEKADNGVMCEASVSESDEEKFQNILLATPSYLRAVNEREFQDLEIVRQNPEYSKRTVEIVEESLRQKELQIRRLNAYRAPRRDDNGKNPFKLYQAGDGQLIFLDRAIFLQLQGRDSLPSEISGEITEIDVHTVNDQTLKQFSFLSHLPPHREFRIISLNNLRTSSDKVPLPPRTPLTLENNSWDYTLAPELRPHVFKGMDKRLLDREDDDLSVSPSAVKKRPQKPEPEPTIIQKDQPADDNAPSGRNVYGRTNNQPSSPSTSRFSGRNVYGRTNDQPSSPSTSRFSGRNVYGRTNDQPSSPSTSRFSGRNVYGRTNDQPSSPSTSRYSGRYVYGRTNDQPSSPSTSRFSGRNVYDQPPSPSTSRYSGRNVYDRTNDQPSSPSTSRYRGRDRVTPLSNSRDPNGPSYQNNAPTHVPRPVRGDVSREQFEKEFPSLAPSTWSSNSSRKNAAVVGKASSSQMARMTSALDDHFPPLGVPRQTTIELPPPRPEPQPAPAEINTEEDLSDLYARCTGSEDDVEGTRELSQRLTRMIISKARQENKPDTKQTHKKKTKKFQRR